jgi:hypothetical protein
MREGRGIYETNYSDWGRGGKTVVVNVMVKGMVNDMIKVMAKAMINDKVKVKVRNQDNIKHFRE